MKKETIPTGELFRTGAARARISRLRPVLLLLLLVAAGVLWYLNGRDAPPASELPQATARVPVSETESVSQTARQRRESAYEKDLAAVQLLMQQASLPEETRKQAAEQASQMIREHQMELGLEEALTGAGYAPCFVLMQNNALTIAVSASEITAAQSAAILSVCLEHTDVPSENIRIMPGVL